MHSEKKLIINIVILMIVLFVLNCLYYILVMNQVGIDTDNSFLFYPISAGFNTIVLSLLLYFRSDFALEKTGKPLTHVNLANILTLMRLTSVPTIGFLIVMAGEFPGVFKYVLIITVIAFLTDFLDGLLSRRARQITKIGKMLDSTSDYSVIIYVTVIFAAMEILPLWLFIFIIIRLVANASGIFFIALAHGQFRPHTTFMGKASVFVLMVLLAAELFELMPGVHEFYLSIILVAEYITGGVIAVSLVEKIWRFIKLFNEVKKSD